MRSIENSGGANREVILGRVHGGIQKKQETGPAVAKNATAGLISGGIGSRE